MSLLVGCITFLIAELYWFLQMAPAVSWSPWISIPAGLLCGCFAAGLAHKATWYVLGFPENALNNPVPMYTWKDEKLAIHEVFNLLNNYRFHGQDLHVDHNEAQRVRASRWFSSRHWTGGGTLGMLSDIYGTVTMSFADIEIDFAVSVRVERYDAINSKVYIEFTNEAKPRIINLWGAPLRKELMQQLVDLLQIRREPYRERPTADPAAVESMSYSQAPLLSENQVMQIWQSANAGDPDSLLQLGRLYAQGAGVVQSWPDAVTCIGMSASKGNVDAMYEWGMMLCQGVGVAPDVQQGSQWLQAAASQGHPGALAALHSIAP